jgi:gluconolactonase
MATTDLQRRELGELLPRSSQLDLVAHGLLFGEGPVWHPAERTLYWSDILGDATWRWTPGVSRDIVMRPSGKANGMTLDAELRRLVAGWGSRSIWRVEHDGSITTLATEFEGRRINTPNDIVVDGRGLIYWTDSTGAMFIPGMQGEDVQRYLDFQAVFRLDPGSGEIVRLTDEVLYPNGLAFSPDETRLYVTDTWGRRVTVFEVGAGGALESPATFYELVGEEPGVADGVKVDVQGNVYVTGPAGVHILDPAGNLLGRLKVPGHATNMAWGGDDWQTLFITSYSSVFRVRMGVPGIPVPQGGVA